MREYRKYNNEEIEDRYQTQIENDIIKYNKCKEHGIQLLYFSNGENIVDTETFYDCIMTTNELITKIDEIIEQNK